MSVSGAILHPIDLWGDLDLSPALACFAAIAGVLGLAALVPSLLGPRRAKGLGTGALVGRSLLGYVGTTLVGTSLFFAFLGLSEYFDERDARLASDVFGYATYGMLVIGPLLVASSFGFDLALAVRARRASEGAGPVVVAVLAFVGLVLHVLLAAVFGSSVLRSV